MVHGHLECRGRIVQPQRHNCTFIQSKVNCRSCLSHESGAIGICQYPLARSRSDVLKHLRSKHWVGTECGYLIHLVVIHAKLHFSILLRDQDHWWCPRTGQWPNGVLHQHLVQFLLHSLPLRIRNPVKLLVDWCVIPHRLHAASP